MDCIVSAIVIRVKLRPALRHGFSGAIFSLVAENVMGRLYVERKMLKVVVGTKENPGSNQVVAEAFPNYGPLI